MKAIQIQDILTATGGELCRQCDEHEIHGVWHDSRECGPGDMFVCIVGENQDGHKYIPQVIEKGCKTLLVSHTDFIPENAEVNAVLVEDTVQAMGKLANWYLNSLGIPKVTVTGSVGKTSVRDMIYYVLSEKYNCGRNLKNYNNEIGLPISIFQFDEKTEICVLEIGMNHFGEIRRLSRIIQPDVAVITNIGVAHIEMLGSRDGIFQAKMEVTENLASAENGGTMVYISDEEYLNPQRISGDFHQVAVGKDGHSHYIVSNIDDFGIEGIQFTLEHKTQAQTIRLPIPGIHNAYNAAAAIAVGGLFGVDIPMAQQGLAKVQLTGSRLKQVKASGVSIIDDSYNANPDSMKSALRVLEKSRTEGQRVAVLGDMFELGEHSWQLHFSVGAFARSCAIDQIVAIGNNAKAIADGAEGGAVATAHFETKDAFAEHIGEYIHKGDVVLLKGSRAMQMEDIIGMIRERL